LARNKPSLDLHVLCAPPALTLSQDQTLRLNGGPKAFALSHKTLRVFPTLQLSKCWFPRRPRRFLGRAKPSVRTTRELYRSFGPLCNGRRKGPELVGRPDPQLVEVGQQARRVVIDPVSAGPLQLPPGLGAPQHAP